MTLRVVITPYVIKVGFRARLRSKAFRRSILSLALVLIAAIHMRFTRLEAVEFFHDEAMVSMMAQELADGETFPLIGINSSVGIPNPPAAVWVMAVPFAFTSDPVIATGFVALLNVIGVALLWHIAQIEYGSVAALCAGLFLALNPWAVLYSRKIWAQDYVVPFLLLALVITLWGFRYRSGIRALQIAALPLMLLAMQIHFAAWALFPLFAWIVWYSRGNIRPGAFRVSVLLGALVMAPYAAGLAQTLQTDTSRLSDVLGREAITDRAGLAALTQATTVATGSRIETWVAPGVSEDAFGPQARWALLIHLGVAFLLVEGALRVWFRQTRWEMWRTGLAVWLLVPVIAFELGLADVWPHYFVPLLPAFALVFAIGAHALWQRIRWGPDYWSYYGAVVIALVVTSLVGFATTYFNVTQYAYENDIEIGQGTSGYTTPAHILNAVRDAIPPDIDDIVVLTDGADVWFDVEAARWPVLLRDRTRCVRALPSDGFYLLPAGRYAVITTPTASDAMRDAYPSDQTVVIEARAGEGRYLIDLRDGAPPERPVLARFSNGAALVGWELDPDSDSVSLTFALPEAPDRTFYGALAHDYQYFVHALDANGNRIGQRDASFWPGRHWCAGDHLTLTVEVAGASGAATLRVGFYRLVDPDFGTTQAVDILDAAGNPAGNWFDIGLR